MALPGAGVGGGGLAIVAESGPAPARPASIIIKRDGFARPRGDELAVEEPLEIRVAGPGERARTLGITMRTPGHDHELAVGLVLADGVAGPHGIRGVADTVDEQTGARLCNVVTVRLTAPVDPALLTRRATATAACGLCGKASLDDLEVRCSPLPDGPLVDSALLEGLPGALRAAQRVFDRTGGLHATGLFDLAGRLLLLREDIGRHNALDKVIGRGVLDATLPVMGGPRDRIVLVSGRLGFELVQKVAVAGYPVVAAVSAPSSLAVEAAGRFGITVVGFLRGADFNVYTRPDRLNLA